MVRAAGLRACMGSGITPVDIEVRWLVGVDFLPTFRVDHVFDFQPIGYNGRGVVVAFSEAYYVFAYG